MTMHRLVRNVIAERVVVLVVGLLAVVVVSLTATGALAGARPIYCARHHHPRGCIPIPKAAQRPPPRVNQQGPPSLTPPGAENGGGLGGGPGNHRLTALTWARTQLRFTEWAWRCERFVEEAYGTRDRFDTARQAAATLPLHRTPIAEAPAGTLVFFAADKANRAFGHVGLSLGKGKMISALSRVEITDVTRSPYWRSLYLGWADAPSTWPGRIPLPPGPTTENPSLTVQITAPAFGSTLAGIIPLAATTFGAAGVDFYAYYASDPHNAATRAWHAIGPGRYVDGAWYVDWDTTQVPDQGHPAWGTVNIAAVALGDTEAQTATRDYRRFSVDNAPSPPPATSPPTTAPPEAAPVGALLFANRLTASSASVIGWAQDPESPASAINVTAFVDGVTAGQGLADQPRGDVGPHGFDFLVTTDENQRSVCVHGTSIAGADAQFGNCLTIEEFGDLNGDGAVNCTDLDILKAHYGQTGDYSDGDLNDDGTVNITDLSIMLSRLSGGCQ